MKILFVVLLTVFTNQLTFAEDGAEDWMTNYYKDPSPEKFVSEVRAMTDTGVLKKDAAQPPLMAFLSQVMRDNPKQIVRWLKEFNDLDEKQRSALAVAAWYSDTDGARVFFKEQKLLGYLENTAPDILELEVNNPSTLDMLWGYFLARGEKEPVKRIVSAFALSKYEGAIERYKTSEKTEQDRKEVFLGVTFKAAMWSVESNCRQHPLVLEHCEKIMADPTLPKAERVWLAVILAKVKPEDYKIEVNGKELGKGGE